MKVYRFAVQDGEDGFLVLECINDPKLFTQARSMDEALYMTRDVVEAMYEITGSLIELVVPPDVVTRSEQRQRERHARAAQKKRRARSKSSTRKSARAA